MTPLIKGMMIANSAVNLPESKKSFNFLPLVIPMSKRKIAKNPLKISVVNGSIPLAYSSEANNPMTRLPRINKTDPFVKA